MMKFCFQTSSPSDCLRASLYLKRALLKKFAVVYKNYVFLISHNTFYREITKILIDKLKNSISCFHKCYLQRCIKLTIRKWYQEFKSWIQTCWRLLPLFLKIFECFNASMNSFLLLISIDMQVEIGRF